jgi:hypothetical protein
MGSALSLSFGSHLLKSKKTGPLNAIVGFYGIPQHPIDKLPLKQAIIKAF